MHDVIKYLNEVLPNAAKKAGIDTDMGIMKRLDEVEPIKGFDGWAIGLTKGFDGDAWVWIWRTYIGKGADRRGIETIVRAQPDTFYERVRIEVSAHAWKEMLPHVSWSMTYGVQVLEIKDFRAQAEESLMPQLSPLLSTAWKQALRQADRLNTSAIFQS